MRIINGPVITSDFIQCTDYDSLCYYPRPCWNFNGVISILFLVWLLAFTLYLMPPVSIVTNCHNLVPKKNEKKNLFLNHFRIVWTLSGSELTRRDQTVVNQSIEIVFPIKCKVNSVGLNLHSWDGVGDGGGTPK